MSSAVVHDRPLSPCNSRAVTSAATGRWDNAFPMSNHPCKTVFCKTAGRLLPSVKPSSERQLTRNSGCCLRKAVREQ